MSERDPLSDQEMDILLGKPVYLESFRDLELLLDLLPEGLTCSIPLERLHEGRFAHAVLTYANGRQMTIVYRGLPSPYSKGGQS